MKKFSSKISYGLLAFVLIILVGSTIATLSTPNWIGPLINLSVLGFVLHLFFNINYIIEGDFLTIKAGFLYHNKIDIGTITKITETKNPISAPAASFQRLEISYKLMKTLLFRLKIN